MSSPTEQNEFIARAEINMVISSVNWEWSAQTCIYVIYRLKINKHSSLLDTGTIS